MKNFEKKEGTGKPSASFVIGAIALVFLIIGYQIALFVHHAAVTRIVAGHDRPDTVFVLAGQASRMISADSLDSRDDGWPGGQETRFRPHGGRSGRGTAQAGPIVIARKNAAHSDAATAIRRENAPRRYESFPFDPNTTGIDDLMRLGFSLKQAQSIDNYRKKGGRFRRKSDFARSYVVEDSVFRRLEPYIDIPKIDLNKADSAAFKTLPGIGKFFAAKMVSYREELGGYSYPEQLMDIWHFDREKFDGLKDLITVGPAAPYPLWTLPEAELKKHPYIGKYAARSIVLFRENSPESEWTVGNLAAAGILPPEQAARLSRCRIAEPQPTDLSR